MIETSEEFEYEKDAVDKILDICRTAEDGAVRQILLGLDYEVTNYEKELKKLGKSLRMGAENCEPMFNRIVNLAFLYLVSKCNALEFTPTSNCEARIQHAVEHIYSTYNVTDDVVKFVITNIALGLDASETFLKKFETISDSAAFYSETDKYIDIFKHIQNLRQSTFRTKDKIEDSDEYLYQLLKKLEFICKLKIIPGEDYVDENSPVSSCSFKIGGNVYPSKYALVKYNRNEYSTEFLFLRSVDDREFPNRKIGVWLNYTDLSDHDTGEITKVFVAGKDFDGKMLALHMPSVGKFYSYITGDLLRKRHRMSFCNGLTSYKYYGELAAAVMDALEIVTVYDDKQFTVIDNYILPVIKNNFNFCKEDCVCTGVGCKFGVRERRCNRDKTIEHENNLTSECLINMDTVSILTIIFSVVGCKEILPQILSQFHFDTPQSYDMLFSQVNKQLDKRFSEFSAEKVDALRHEFYKKSIDYLSLNLDENKREDKVVAQTLKPFKIRAYTDALVTTLENLDRERTVYNVNPSEDVYTISGKIDLLNGLGNITVEDIRSALRDTLKIILTYYTGLANCKGQQLNYEIQAEQVSALNDETVKGCYEAINDAFMDGVFKKLSVIGRNPSFYTLFTNLFEDVNDLKSEISIMLGREMVNVMGLRRFIELDEKNKKCYLVERKRKDDGFETVYRCDLDDEKMCGAALEKFKSRVVELLEFFKGDELHGARFSCYPQVLIHTSSKVNVDNTTINAFTVYDNEHYTRKKEYNVITYFAYEISKRYYYIAPKKFEKTRWITYPILIQCSDFYKHVIKENFDE